MRRQLLNEVFPGWKSILNWLLDQVWPPDFFPWGQEGVKPPTAGQIKVLRQFRKSGEKTPPANVLKILRKYKSVNKKAKKEKKEKDDIKERLTKSHLKRIIKEEIKRIKRNKVNKGILNEGKVEWWCECGKNEGCYGSIDFEDQSTDCSCCMELYADEGRVRTDIDPQTGTGPTIPEIPDIPLSEQNAPNPKFEKRMYKGVQKFGCSFLMTRGQIIAQNLADSGGKGPRWMSMLRNKIAILRDVAVTSGCGNLPLNV